MKKKEDDIFELVVDRDLDGFFYKYLVDDTYEVTDPYSKASSINSLMSSVVDLSTTDPEGFRDYKAPINKENDAIIYELNVKDYTAHPSSGVKNRGKFIGLGEFGRSFKDFSTGLSHLKELGVTHIQLLPIYDFITTFEEPYKFFDDDNYNWGYDPELYFNVEGSYATDPYNPKTRIYELKKMIQEIHKQGMSVVMDVVFNHTFKALDSNLEMLAPGYYHRREADGSLANGTGVGNEIASEKPFTRKLIIDSLKYWVKEFKIDGFRFDLMAVIDLETMKIALKELKKINENIVLYGEPWMAFSSPLAMDQQIWIPRQKSNGFGVFNDRFRDAIKGDNDGYGVGYIQGDYSLKTKIEEGMAGSINFDQERPGICDYASETINYFNCHDNLIFYDKLMISLNDKILLDEVSKLAFGILFLSLGKPFIYEGNEFHNTKFNDSNSYSSPLKINAVDWKLKEKNYDLFLYVRDIISLRKDNREFLSMVDPKEIRKRMKFIEGLPDHMVGYLIKGSEESLLTLINAGISEEIFDFTQVLNLLDDKRNSKEIRKIFDKKGKINKSLSIGKEEKLNQLSVNVYKIGGSDGRLQKSIWNLGKWWIFWPKNKRWTKGHSRRWRRNKRQILPRIRIWYGRS